MQSGLIWIGGAIIALGWILLLFGTGVDAGNFTVMNLHRAAIAQTTIGFGCFLVIAGLIKSGLDRLAPQTNDAASNPSVGDTQTMASTVNADPASLGARIEAMKNRPR